MCVYRSALLLRLFVIKLVTHLVVRSQCTAHVLIWVEGLLNKDVPSPPLSPIIEHFVTTVLNAALFLMGCNNDQHHRHANVDPFLREQIYFCLRSLHCFCQNFLRTVLQLETPCLQCFCLPFLFYRGCYALQSADSSRPAFSHPTQMILLHY